MFCLFETVGAGDRGLGLAAVFCTRGRLSERLRQGSRSATTLKLVPRVLVLQYSAQRLASYVCRASSPRYVFADTDALRSTM